MWETILDALLDAVLDTVKIIPFLLITYLAMEWLEHRTGDKTKHAVEKAGKMGPLFGGLLGVVPQCGFSAAAASLYAGRVITIGTLLAVFLSTSDEMLPILLSSGVANLPLIGKILAVKVVYGVAAGFGVDILHRFLVAKGILGKRRMLPASTDKRILEEEPGTEHIKDLCEQERCHCDNGFKGILKSAVVHTLQITTYLFVITLVLNVLMEFGGEEFIGKLFTANPVIQAIIAGVIGLIPNCASSVVLTQLYLEGIIGVGALVAGLLVGAGAGLLVLLKTNRSFISNAKVIGSLYIIGVVGGLAVSIFSGGFSGGAKKDLPVYTEEVHITIPGMTREVKIAYLSDLHIVTMSDDIPEENRDTVNGRIAWSSDEGVSSADQWAGWVDTLNESGADFVLFGGDMVDFCSEATMETLKKDLDRLTIPYMYIRADHDTTSYYIDGIDYYNCVDMQREICEYSDAFVQEFPEFCIVGWNMSTSLLNPEGMEKIRAAVDTGKPLILLTHVPICPQGDDSLYKASADVYQGRALIWGYSSHLGYFPDETDRGQATAELLDLLYKDDSPFKEVLCGHLHLSWDGNISKNVKQHVFSAAFNRYMGIITISGE